MRKVLATLSSHGGICCHEENCLYNRECANHVTAGDFRSEGGFSPDLKIVGTDKEVHCDSVDQNPLYEDYRTVPVNHDKLKSGEVYLDKDGILQSYDPFHTNRYLEYPDIDDDYHCGGEGYDPYRTRPS